MQFNNTSAAKNQQFVKSLLLDYFKTAIFQFSMISRLKFINQTQRINNKMVTFLYNIFFWLVFI